LGYLFFDVGAVSLFLGIYGARLPSFCRPLVYLGKLSYGLYVFHFLALLALGLYHPKYMYVPALVATFACAVVSYYCLEMPFLKLKRRFVYVKNRED
jgi:peptidoglycan/LPS O-acetylase OafA/YrhL